MDTHLRVTVRSDEKEIALEEILSPQILDLDPRDECKAQDPIYVHGKVSHIDSWVILEARVQTSITVQCAICNEDFAYEIDIPMWKIEEELKGNTEAIIDFTTQLREAVILEFPFYARCGRSRCKQMDSMKKYIKQKKEQEVPLYHRPFESLLSDFEEIK